MLLFCTKLQKVTLVVFPVKNDRTAINFLQICHYAILSPIIGFNLFVNLFSFI